MSTVLNKLHVASSACVKLLNLARTHLVILSEQTINGWFYKNLCKYCSK